MQRGVTATTPTAVTAAQGVAVPTTSRVVASPLFTTSYYLLVSLSLITLMYLVVLHAHA